jgi:hypothetical protein
MENLHLTKPVRQNIAAACREGDLEKTKTKSPLTKWVMSATTYANNANFLSALPITYEKG